MTSKQRAYLRGLANKLTPIFQVGKNGITDTLTREINDAIGARELIKISVLETSPDDIQEVATTLASRTNSALVQTVGNKVTLFRAKKKDSKIELPR